MRQTHTPAPMRANAGHPCPNITEMIAARLSASYGSPVSHDAARAAVEGLRVARASCDAEAVGVFERVVRSAVKARRALRPALYGGGSVPGGSVGTLAVRGAVASWGLLVALTVVSGGCAGVGQVGGAAPALAYKMGAGGAAAAGKVQAGAAFGQVHAGAVYDAGAGTTCYRAAEEATERFEDGEALYRACLVRRGIGQ